MPRPCVNRIEQIYYYKILMQKKPTGGSPESIHPCGQVRE